jgi:maltose/moltooligosaccharide transporter
MILLEKQALAYWVYASFFLGAVCSIGSIWWSMTKEIPPTTEELEHIRSSKGGVLIIEIYRLLATCLKSCGN